MDPYRSFSNLLSDFGHIRLPIYQKGLKYRGGFGGGQVVSVLAFYSNDQSSNPVDAYIFFQTRELYLIASSKTSSFWR